MIIDYIGVTIGSVLDEVSFNLSKGEFVMLTGSDSIAISQLIRSLYGDISVGGEKASVLDQSVINISRTDLALLRKEIGVVLPQSLLATDLTIVQILESVLSAQNTCSDTEYKVKIFKLVNLLEIHEHRDRLISELSDEVKQLVCIAAALIKEPQLFLADQPTIYLSESNIELIMKVVYDYSSNLQMTSLLATHDHQLLRDYPSRILQVLNQKVVDSPQ